MKLITVVGARPQFIKAAAISRAIASYNSSNITNIDEIIVHTGQHYDHNMSQAFFNELNIPQPNYNLEVGSGLHGQQTGKMLEGIEKIALSEKPDWILVYGDTNSTIAGALVGAKLHIPIAHVEAGLRSFNKKMPEEINRILTDHISTLLFCPTQTSVNNLTNEGIKSGVELVGDVMFDCSLYYSQKLSGEENKILESFGVNKKSYYLATIHRAENTDDTDKLTSILSAFNEISSEKSPVVLPLHPRTKNILKTLNFTCSEYLRIIDPVPYLQMIVLENNASIILTDSGGIQKEAYFYKVPCLTLREETEWVETVESGWNSIVGANRIDIISKVKSIEDNAVAYSPISNLYGDGNTAKKIIDIIAK